MGRFLLSRVVRSAILLLALVSVVFILTRTFADPARLMLPLNAPRSDYIRLREQLGLDEPLWAQLVDFLLSALQGDFGRSVWLQADAFSVVLQRVPATMQLAFAAIAVALLFGVALGIAGGMRPNSRLDTMVQSTSSAAVAIPDFWLGIMLILLFAVEFRIFPTSGKGGLASLVLPAVSLSLRPLGRSARLVREQVAAEMSKRYVTTARAKGMTEGQVLRRHVLKNIMPVALTVLAYDFVFIFTGYAAYVETVFDWPGMGKLAVEAVMHQDINLVAAVVFVAGIVVALVNTATDISHAWIDKRVSL